MTRSQSYSAWPGLGCGPGLSSLPASPSAAAVLPPIPRPGPLSPPQVLEAGPPSAPRSPGQGGSHLPDVLGAGLVHVSPACASHSTQPPRLTGSLCMASQQGWGVGSSERPRSPQAEGQTCWGSENGGTGVRCLAVLPGSRPSHSWSSVGDSPGSSDIQPGPFLHHSLHRGIMMAHGGSTGDPGVHGSSRTTEKGVRAWLMPGSGACPGPAPAASFAGRGATWTRACAAWPASGSSGWCPCHWPTAQ